MDQERYSIQRFARKINGRVFGKPCVSHQTFHSALHCGCHNPPTLLLVLCSHLSCMLSNLNLLSHQLPPQSTVPVPMRNPRCPRCISVSHSTTPRGEAQTCEAPTYRDHGRFCWWGFVPRCTTSHSGFRVTAMRGRRADLALVRSEPFVPLNSWKYRNGKSLPL